MNEPLTYAKLEYQDTLSEKGKLIISMSSLYTGSMPNPTPQELLDEAISMSGKNAVMQQAREAYYATWEQRRKAWAFK
jgi:hypothetical protein